MDTYIDNTTTGMVITGGTTIGTVTTDPFIFTTQPDILNTFNYSTNLIDMTNKIQQTKVAVFYVTRNDNQEIINTEFLKEMWIQTKAGCSVEFEVARDKDLSKYKSTDLVIKVITSIVF